MFAYLQQQQLAAAQNLSNSNKPKASFRCGVCSYETSVARNLRIHWTSEKHTHNMVSVVFHEKKTNLKIPSWLFCLSVFLNYFSVCLNCKQMIWIGFELVCDFFFCSKRHFNLQKIFKPFALFSLSLSLSLSFFCFLFAQNIF